MRYFTFLETAVNVEPCQNSLANGILSIEDLNAVANH